MVVFWCRRHLTDAQRVAIALAAVPHYEKEARGRQSAAGGDHRSVPIGTERFANSPTKRAFWDEITPAWNNMVEACMS